MRRSPARRPAAAMASWALMVNRSACIKNLSRGHVDPSSVCRSIPAAIHVSVARVETVLLIVLIVVVVGGWLAIHRARRQQLRAEASEAEHKKKARH